VVDENCPFINQCKKALSFELGYGDNAFFLPKNIDFKVFEELAACNH